MNELINTVTIWSGFLIEQIKMHAFEFNLIWIKSKQIALHLILELTPAKKEELNKRM